MKKLSFLVPLILLLMSTATQAQIAINEDGSSPDNTAILDVKSSQKGILIPRMTNSQRNQISSPATGLIIYNTSSQKFNYYNGSTWIALSSETFLSDADNDTKVQVEKTFDEDIIRMEIGELNAVDIQKKRWWRSHD